MVSTRPVISKFSSPCTNPLLTVPREPITIGVSVTFMFRSFFNSLARSRYLSFFSLSFNFTLWSAGTAKSTILQVLLYCWLLKGMIVWSRLGDPFVSQKLRGICASHFPGQLLGCANIICLYGQISISCTIPSGLLLLFLLLLLLVFHSSVSWWTFIRPLVTARSPELFLVF